MALERKTEREWKIIQCPRRGERTVVMCEWNVTSEGGKILRRTLRQIDCHHPQWGIFGESGCDWPCERLILKGEK